MQQPPFTPEQYQRYQRHLNLPGFGPEGQQALRAGSVLLVGAGGLGSPLALYLAAAGVGRIGLLDFDVVDLSNLQRQVLYTTADVGAPKVEVAARRIRALNPEVETLLHAERLDAENAMELLAPYDVVVDGTDNFPTRYLVNDACVLLGKANVYGAILRFEGQASTFDAARGPCYRCLFAQPPPPELAPSCAEGGVLGVLPGMIALVQATETLKLLSGVGEPLIGRFLQYDALAMRWNEFHFAKDPKCALCGEQPTISELVDYEGFCGVQPAAERPAFSELSAAELKQRLAQQGAGDELLLLDVREPEEYERAHIEGARLLPLGELSGRLSELADWKARPLVVHCHKGGRSSKACAQLAAAGFSKVFNLAGGIDAWSLSVDAGTPRY